MRALIVIAIVLGHHAVAEAKCRRSGKVIYEEVQAPLPGHEDSVPDRTFRIFASGGYSIVQEMPDGQEPASHGGCIAKKHFELLQKALARATFKAGAQQRCDAVPERSLTYAAPRRKKRVTIDDPCGATLDASTHRLVQCATTVDDGLTPAEVRGVCTAP